jgi:hypothetical protein
MIKIVETSMDRKLLFVFKTLFQMGNTNICKNDIDIITKPVVKRKELES